MNVVKRFLLGVLYAVPCAVAVWFIVYLFNTDPNMVRVISYAGYATIGIFFMVLFFTILLGLFSLSLMSLRHLFNLKRYENKPSEDTEAAKLADKITD